MIAAIRGIDELLHAAATGRTPPSHTRVRMWIVVICCAFSYGAAMGSFGFAFPTCGWQMLYSGIKVPLLLLCSTLLCLPAFFVLNTLLGLRDDLPAALDALRRAQGVLAVALGSLAPLTIVWYASTMDYRSALLFNAALFFCATIAGQAVLRRAYGALIARRPRHGIALWCWLVLYAFVGIQMGWTLRPFVGAPGVPTTFFRQEPFSNAYVVMLDLVLHR